MMDNSIIAGMVTNFAIAIWALPILLLGLWLSIKSWAWYPLVVIGLAWMTLIISGGVYSIVADPDIATLLKVMLWSIPPIFFIGVNLGLFMSIQAIREQPRTEG